MNQNRVNRQTVDLSAYPDLVVIYLGMRVRTLRGVPDFTSFRPSDRAGGGGET